jgi:predicted nucleic acid-binding protein
MGQLALLQRSPDVSMIAITQDVLERAANLRATVGLKTPDAIHAATALVAGCALLVTNDPAFRRVAGLPVGLLSEALP